MLAVLLPTLSRSLVCWHRNRLRDVHHDRGASASSRTELLRAWLALTRLLSRMLLVTGLKLSLLPASKCVGVFRARSLCERLR